MVAVAATLRNQSEIVERIMEEHDALRDKVARIHSVLADPAPNKNEIDELLREFLRALIVHFANEEEEGFFDEVAAKAPYLAGSAAKLCVEHRQMLQDAKELCRFAAAGSPSMPWWRELNTRCYAFSARFMNHECQENKLLHEAHKVDIGAYD
jgi:hemerythrin